MLLAVRSEPSSVRTGAHLWCSVDAPGLERTDLVALLREALDLRLRDLLVHLHIDVLVRGLEFVGVLEVLVRVLVLVGPGGGLLRSLLTRRRALAHPGAHRADLVRLVQQLGHLVLLDLLDVRELGLRLGSGLDGVVRVDGGGLVRVPVFHGGHGRSVWGLRWESRWLVSVVRRECVGKAFEIRVLENQKEARRGLLVNVCCRSPLAHC
mmetsp:Transcript_8211/g.37378  ORF Transcript_8211/g.37378 Transcript_8211/m.37378 type:complete len:209 (+) Transcript_8211:6959-7585(+)